MAPPADVCVTLRWLPVDAVAPGRWPALRQILDDSEQARAERFHFERDRQAYIAAHALTRVVLSQVAARPPQTWRFVAGAHGKPTLDGGALRFNLSHTRALVAVAVATGGEIGLDVERLDPQRLEPELTERIFAPAERAHLRSLSGAAQTEAAYAFWTLKEAYIKAIGLGLACPLDAFHFGLDPLGIRFSPRLADDPAQWLFRRWRPLPDHLMAIAVKHPAPDRVRVDARALRDDELPG